MLVEFIVDVFGVILEVGLVLVVGICIGVIGGIVVDVLCWISVFDVFVVGDGVEK